MTLKTAIAAKQTGVVWYESLGNISNLGPGCPLEEINSLDPVLHPLIEGQIFRCSLRPVRHENHPAFPWSRAINTGHDIATPVANWNETFGPQWRVQQSGRRMSPRQVQVRHGQTCILIGESAFDPKQPVPRTESSISNFRV